MVNQRQLRPMLPSRPEISRSELQHLVELLYDVFSGLQHDLGGLLGSLTALGELLNAELAKIPDVSARTKNAVSYAGTRLRKDATLAAEHLDLITSLPPPRDAPTSPLVTRLGTLADRISTVSEATVVVARSSKRSLTVLFPFSLLASFLLEIIANARKAKGSAPKILLSWRIAAQDLEIAIQDDGPGLSPEELAALPTSLPRGLGLRLIRLSIHRIGGRLVIDASKVSTGVRVRMFLPTRVIDMR
jgi:signal transduction histidine kinase